MESEVGSTQSYAAQYVAIPQIVSYFCYYAAYKTSVHHWDRLVKMVDGYAEKYFKNGRKKSFF